MALTYYQSIILTAGASHYWPLDDPSGTTARDLAGSAPGTISGGVTLNQPGVTAVTSAMTFDGTTGKIVTAATVTVPLVVTIEAWIQTTGASYHTIWSTRNPEVPQTFVFLAQGPGLAVYGTPTLAVGVACPVNTGAWHHVVAVFDGSTVLFYVDGLVLTAPQVAVRAANTGRVVSLGGEGAGNYFPGQLQDMAIYPRALSATEIAEHWAARLVLDPPGLEPGEQAYLYARSGIARSGATRSNYVAPFSTVDLIERDPTTGAIIARTDLTDYIRVGSLQITQALNDEPDTCSFQIVPTAPPSAVPGIGQEIAVAWAPGDVLFQGYALVIQYDRRPMNESPWVSVQCQDAMWRFDARIVTYRFPTQSVSESIALLVREFCNLDPVTPSPLDFRTTAVEPGMPSMPGFDVVNQRPSTVMRTLLAGVGGGFYIDGLDVHAWAGTLSEPGQTNPQPLTNDLATLKAFRITQDATQVRRAVVVEGRRTQTLIALPAIDTTTNDPIGIPLVDATLFDPTLGIDHQHLVRVGTQWLQVQNPVSEQTPNPPQTRLAAAFTVGDPALVCDAIPSPPPLQGWIRIGNQYAAYQSSETTGATLTLTLAGPVHGYGWLTVPMEIGETVEWVDCVMEDYPLSNHRGSPPTGAVLSQPPETPVVVFAEAQAALGAWPPLTAFVQDGRYSYAGALARAAADLAAFADPLVSAEWDTDDLNAHPGRVQAMNLTGTSVIDPVTVTLTITRVELAFPLRTQPPRRRVSGGVVKPSTFLDLVLTDES